MPSTSTGEVEPVYKRSDVAPLPPCSLISLEGADQGNQEASQRELRATQSTVECIEACRIDEIFADTKFLKAESLHELVKAIMWVSGPVMRIAATGEDSDVAEVSCGRQGHPDSAAGLQIKTQCFGVSFAPSWSVRSAFSSL